VAAVVEAAPARDCRAASAAWVAESARQWAAAEVALLVEVPQAAGHKLVIISMKVQRVQGQAAQPKLRKAVAVAVAARRILQAAKALRRQERPVWPAQPQPEAQPKPSKVRVQRKRINCLSGNQFFKKDQLTLISINAKVYS